VLGELGAHLPADQQEVVMAEALVAAYEIHDGWRRASVLGELGAHLPVDQQEVVMVEALATAREIQDEWNRAEVLGELGVHLPDNLMAEALAAVREIQDEESRARGLGKLGTHLPVDQQEMVIAEALAVAREVEDSYSRGTIYSNLAMNLSDDLLLQTISWICADVVDSPEVFREFSRRWHSICWKNPKEGFNILATIFETYANQSRSVLLDRIRDLAPVLFQLGGTDLILTTVNQVLATAKWWQ
jgi:hypothetical protein